MDRCWHKGELGDAVHAVLCAAGYNLKWLLRAIVALGLKPNFLYQVLAVFMREYGKLNNEFGPQPSVARPALTA